MEETSHSSASAAEMPANRSELFVVSIGGSLFFAQDNLSIDLPAVQRLASMVHTLSLQGYKFALVVGGGKAARSYIDAGKQLGASQFALDEIGILLTRANAQLFIQALPNACSHVLTDLKEAKTVLDKKQIPVFGGLLPGFTTDTVAALLAEKLGGTFVNLSNVDGVYSSDPKTNKKAKLFREVSFEQLFEIVASLEIEAGFHGIVDVPAAIILKRSRIPSIFVNGNNLENVESAIQGKPFNGTIVQASETENSQATEEETPKD